ncbi:MAG: hypothetical protein LWW97_09880 [Deltaproteobacteria bacterium]|nr:hypothetical protein [Deltaproteobacteria bacterium]
MSKKGGKSISFDVMVKFFIRHYDIPTKKDLAYLMTKIDHLETLIKSKSAPGKSKHSAKSAPKRKEFDPASSLTASDMVMKVIKKSGQGADFAEIQVETGFGEKKLRNIIFRLNQTEKIKRKRRGVYIVS